MKKLFLFCLVVAHSSFSITASAEMKILNGYPKDGFFYVMVEYTNDGNETYETFTLKCDALDTSKNIINSNERSFSGPIKPGFKVTVKLPIDSLGKNVKSTSCNSLSE